MYKGENTLQKQETSKMPRIAQECIIVKWKTLKIKGEKHENGVTETEEKKN